MYDRQALLELVRERALKFGEFTLVSGKKASYYLDGKQVTLSSEGAKLVAEGMLELMGDSLPKAVGGMAIGADPITAAIITIARGTSKELLGFMVRKEAKGHGLQRFIEGPVAEGDEVVIVEDVVTTGGSSLLAIERCEAYGLKVRGVLAVIDRMEGGRENFESKGYKFDPLFTIQDFGIEPPAPDAG